MSITLNAFQCILAMSIALNAFQCILAMSIALNAFQCILLTSIVDELLPEIATVIGQVQEFLMYSFLVTVSNWSQLSYDSQMRFVW